MDPTTELLHFSYSDLYSMMSHIRRLLYLLNKELCRIHKWGWVQWFYRVEDDKSNGRQAGPRVLRSNLWAEEPGRRHNRHWRLHRDLFKTLQTIWDQ